MTLDPRDALTGRYNTFIERETPWLFFIGLYDYIEYMLVTPQFSWTVERELGKRDVQYKLIELAEKKAAAEMEESKDRLLQIIKIKKINVDNFSRDESYIPSVRRNQENVIEQLEMYECGLIGLGGFHSDNLRLFLSDIAVNLLKLGYKKEVEKFLVSNEEYRSYYARINGNGHDLWVSYNLGGNFIFSKTWPKRFELVRQVELERKMEPWGAFEEITKVWHARRELLKSADLQEVVEDCKNDARYRLSGHEAVQVAYIMDDIKKMSENHGVLAMHLKYFQLPELKAALMRVQTILVQKSASDVAEEQMDARAMTKALRTKKDEVDRKLLIERVEALENRIVPIIEIKKGMSTESKPDLDEIYYDSKTGFGNINGREFKIKPSDSLFNVFASLYGIINTLMSRQEVLIASGFYEEGQDPDSARKKEETYHINEIAKSIRTKLKIDKSKLKLNGGSLMLIGKKVKHPKTSQVAPN